MTAPGPSPTLITGLQAWGDHRLLTLESLAVAAGARPGQFVMVRVADGHDPLLRRPLGIHDVEGSSFALFFKIAGRGTALLGRRRPGEVLDVLGPLGRGFRLPEGPASGSALLVAGGRGIAPLFFLGRALARRGRRVRVLYGGRTGFDIPLRARLEEAGFAVTCSTDDGSFGCPGLVTDLAAAEMDREPPAAVYACGPEAMMSALAGQCRARGLPAQFSLEAVMGCGMGACWGCVHRTRAAGREAWTKICEEGPVFDRDAVVWSEGG